MTGSRRLNREWSGHRAAFATIVAVGALYATLALLRLIQFDATAFDAGLFDNVLWRLGNGYNDVTDLTGSHHFSDHMSLLMLAAAPIYAIAPQLGLPALIVAQAASVALVSAAAWLLADHVNLDDRTKRAVLVVTLIGAGTYNAALIDIHEVGLAVGPLAMTAAMGLRGARLRTYWIWPVLAAAARFDIAVSVLVIGFLLRRERHDHSRIAIGVGAGFAGAMLVWLLANPWEGTSFAFHFAHLGIDSAAQLPAAILRDPIAAIEPLFDPVMWATIAIWLMGFTALAPLRAAKWILPALPTVIIPALGSWPSADRPETQYWHVLLPMLAIAMVLGYSKASALRERATYLAVAAVAVTWIFTPIFKPSFGQDLSDERAVVAYLALQPNASVAVLGNLVPHVSQRPSVMQLPTPFACPTIPIASFRGPDNPPDLVAVSTVLLEQKATAAAADVAAALDKYYERVEIFGEIEIWRVVGSVPAPIYSGFCAVAGSENS